MKKVVGPGVGSGSGSGSISQRYGSGDPDPDPDPHKNFTDPQQLVAGDLDGGERDGDAALLCVALRHRGEGDAGSRHTRRRQEQVSAPGALKGHLRKMIFLLRFHCI